MKLQLLCQTHKLCTAPASIWIHMCCCCVMSAAASVMVWASFKIEDIQQKPTIDLIDGRVKEWQDWGSFITVTIRHYIQTAVWVNVPGKLLLFTAIENWNYYNSSGVTSLESFVDLGSSGAHWSLSRILLQGLSFNFLNIPMNYE